MDMVLNLTQIKETTEEVLILTPITLHINQERF